MTNQRLITAQELTDYCAELFKCVGVPQEEAIINADNLVEANLAGIDSHGVSRMGIYLKRIRENVVNPACQLEIEKESPATVRINGKNSMGAAVGEKAMKMAIDKAKKVGVSYVTVNNSNHFGTCAYYSKMALEHNMIGFVATNSPPRMAPWGSSEPYFGTNPFSIAIPAGDCLPIVVDMATSVVARGKIILAEKNNEKIPEGWALNERGEVTTDPTEALTGSVMPFGGPKGSALALVVDVLSGVLSGAASARDVKDMYGNFDEPMNAGHIFGVLNIEMFIEQLEFKASLDKLIRDIKSSTPVAGVEEVFLPGEIELRKREKHLREGIPLSESTLRELENEGNRCGVPFPFATI